MHAGEWIVRVKSVIELGVKPVGSGVTGPAIVRQPELHVRWILAGREVLLMAGKARGWRSFEHVVYVTCRTGQRRMRSDQSVPSHFEMVEPGIEPRVHGMAVLTRGRKTGGDVIDCLSSEILLVARVAGGREPGESPSRGIFVAINAGQQGVRADEGKAIEVIANIFV